MCVRVFSDLHIHSKYSAATSMKMDLNSIAKGAEIKGLNVVGTGDIIHPKWFDEVRSQLTTENDSGLFRLVDEPRSTVRFMTTCEVATVYEDGGKTRKIHHALLLPSLEVAEQVSDVLSNEGNLQADGRPVLRMSSPALVERLRSVCKDIEVIPAHAWTPWWSILGAFSGYDSIEECYGDQSQHIHALETGLSSDPPMNWRSSRLHKYTLISNSDCHSPYPYRLGREANIFELKELTYNEIVDVIRKRDPERFLSTIETKPEYGKYHFSGHRRCGVSLSGAEAITNANRCPKCGKKLTKGVEQRVEELADRRGGFILKNVPSYHYLLPLHELISTLIGASGLQVGRVQSEYDKLIKAFNTEFGVMLFASLADIEKIAGKELAKAIEAVRTDTVKVLPGYDGVYGVLDLSSISD